MNKEIIITVESKIYKPNTQTLSKYGKIQQTISRILFNEMRRNSNLIFKDKQKEYGKKFNIHVRLFKTIWKDVKGKIQAITSNKKNQLNYLNEKIIETQEKINDKEKIIYDTKTNTTKIQKNNISYFLKNKLEKLKNKITQITNKTINAIWGSKKLFNKQWQYLNRKEWKKEWQRKRNNLIYLIGSKDETFGNSLCQLKNLKTLTLTLPRELGEKYLKLDVDFDKKKKNGKQKELYSYLINAINNKKALTYKIFERENGNWYVQITFKYENGCEEQSKNLGIDINYNLFTSCIVKKDGNPEEFKDFKFDLEGKNKGQIKEELIKVSRKIMQTAKENKTNLVIENIDLKDKKNRDLGKRTNRKLHLIVYAKFIQILKYCATKNGILVIEINPAYSSIIAKIKYKTKLGRSIHQCASMVIARRGLGFSEKIPSKLACLLHGEEKKKHNWAKWNLLNRRLKNGPCKDTLVDFTVSTNDIWSSILT